MTPFRIRHYNDGEDESEGGEKVENTNYELIIALVLGAIWAAIMLFVSPFSGTPIGLSEPSKAVDISSVESLRVDVANTMLFFDNAATALFYPKDLVLKHAASSLKIAGPNGRIIVGTKRWQIRDVRVNGANITIGGNADLKEIELDGLNVAFMGSFDLETLKIAGTNIRFDASLSNVKRLRVSGANVSGTLRLHIDKPCEVNVSSAGGRLNIHIPEGKRQLLKFHGGLANVSIVEE